MVESGANAGKTKGNKAKGARLKRVRTRSSADVQCLCRGYGRTLAFVSVVVSQQECPEKRPSTIVTAEDRQA